jgi:hypothetical protein
MDSRVARAAQKHDVWALVPLADEYAAGPVGAQAAQALVALIPDLVSRRKMNELSFILTLDLAENLRAAATAAADALIAIGPKAKQLVSARATSAAGQRHAAQYFAGHDHPLPSGSAFNLRIDERREGGDGAPRPPGGRRPCATTG